MSKRPVKKRLFLILFTVIAVILLLVLVFWDPANLLRLRKVDSASGLYLVEEPELSDDGLSIDGISFSENGTATIIINNNEGNLIATYDVSNNITILDFSYNKQDYSIFCTRKSNAFKLMGTTPCDYLQCSFHIISDNTKTIVGSFVATNVPE